MVFAGHARGDDVDSPRTIRTRGADGAKFEVERRPALLRFKVEAVVACGGDRLATAGGRDVCVWDALDGKAPIHRFRDAHARACGALCVDAERQRLVSAGLDGLVKVHSLADHATVVKAAARYAREVLCVAVAPENRALAAGTAGGALDVRARETKAPGRDRKQSLAPPPGTFRHFTRGRGYAPTVAEPVVGGDGPKKKKLRPHDEALRSFRYGDALDEALRTRDPTVVAAVLAELERRGGRAAALRGRDEKRLEPVLAFVAAHVAHPRYASALSGVADALLDAYASKLGGAPAVDELFAKIRQNVADEAAAQEDLLGLAGTLDVLLCHNDRMLRESGLRD